MAFYVPLGPRGVLFRLGTFVIGIWGGVVYRLASRRRGLPGPDPPALDHSRPRLIGPSKVGSARPRTSRWQASSPVLIQQSPVGIADVWHRRRLRPDGNA